MASNYTYHQQSSNANLQANTPYGSGDPYYNASSGYITPIQPKKRRSNWIRFGIPLVILVIVAAVVGGVVGSHHHNDDSSSFAAAASASQPTGSAAVSQALSIKNEIGIYPTGTDSYYMLPLYPATTNTAAFTLPTFVAASNDPLAWPTDSFSPSNPQPTSVRTDRPRLIAPTYKWNALPQLIQNDPYLKSWNESIFQNATEYYGLPPVVYFMDGSSGILDNAREIKMRIKAFAYAYRMSNQTSWVDRAWAELQNAAGNSSQGFGPGGPDIWNPTHFLDTAEFVNAFAFAYDWLYDMWTPQQKESIMWTMLEYGMKPGIVAFSNSDGRFTGWWQNNTQGNWNCVCTGGLTVGSLALLGDDTSGTSEALLALTIPNSLQNCVQAVSPDGSWLETPHYWGFGTNAHTEMAVSLMTAAGSDFGLMTENPSFALTGLFHMSSNGPGTIFSYGDHGPNTYSTTANSLLFYGDYYERPEYVLYQRDQHDAVEPFGVFYYNPVVTGAFWDQLALDHFFTNNTDQWVAMRSSWTDENAMYVAMKAGTLTGHQTHNDLDCGDFVIDALGTRWAGDLGSEDYNSVGYFSSDDQQSERWLYYRKRTEGQNTILVGAQNFLVSAQPTIMANGSTGEVQGSSTVYDVPSTSTAFFVADLTTTYSNSTFPGNVTTWQRGIRMINGRQQVLQQDDITASQPFMWRMHTNATVSIDSNDATKATLTIDNETLQMQILNAPSGAAFSTMEPIRLDTDPPLPPGETDMPNPTVTVVTIQMPAGQYSLQVLFNPQWPGMSASDFVTPPSVPLSQWSLDSHN